MGVKKMGKITIEVIKNLFFSLFLTLMLTVMLRLNNSLAGVYMMIALYLFTFIYLNLFSWSYGKFNLEKLNELEEKINKIGYLLITIDKNTEKKR